MTADPSRQLILASATGYTWTDLAPFAESLRVSGFSGKTILFTTELPQEDAAKLRACGIEPVSIKVLPHKIPPQLRNRLFNWRLQKVYRLADRLNRWLPLPASGRTWLKARWGARLQHIACTRYLHYYRYLCRHKNEFDSIMLTDVRDVIFQGHPFDQPLKRPLRFFLEHPSTTIASEPHNRVWLGDIYGADTLARLGGKVVSCSGVTYGTRDGMLDYLRAMVDELVAAIPVTVGFNGYDQGVHNYLIWTGRFPDSELVETDAGNVLTLQNVPIAELHFDGDGCLLNNRRARASVVHQYNRDPELNTRLLALIPPLPWPPN